MVQVRKKGFLFTITTLAMLSLLFLFSSIYMERSREIQDFAAGASLADKIRHIESDIAEDYFDLTGMDLKSIKRGDGKIEVHFGILAELSGTRSYTDFADYESFVEGRYSNLTNTEIILENFNQYFALWPYNASFQANASKFVLYTSNSSAVRYIGLNVTVNEALADKIDEGYPADDSGSYPTINVTINDKDNALLLARELQLNPGEANDAFFVRFNSTGLPNISIEFGIIDGKNSTLMVIANNLEANITGLDLEYGMAGELVQLRTMANITINPRVRGFSKQGNIVLAEG